MATYNMFLKGIEVPTLDALNSNFLSKTNTTAYNPTANYNPATKKYVDDCIAAINQLHFEIVAELPTTGESTIIYMVLADDGGEEDYYNEYIYINDTWEKIGNTRIDLTPYATIEYVDASAVKLPKYYILAHGSYNNEIPTSQYSKLVEIVNYYLKYDSWPYVSWNSDSGCNVPLNNVNINKNAYYVGITFNLGLTPAGSNSGTSWGISYRYLYGGSAFTIYVKPSEFEDGEVTNVYSDSALQQQTRISVGYSGGGVARVMAPSTSLPLGTTNTVSFTPTGDYNPATKKYVDDAISGGISSVVIGATHSRLGTDATNSWWVHDYNINTEVGNNSLGTLANIILSVYNDCISFIKDINLTHLIRIHTLNDVLIEWKFGNSTSWNPKTYRSYVYVYYKNSGLIATRSIYANPNLRTDGTIESWYNFDWSDTTLNALGVANTTSYTPTANYHPATKKYVDDSISNIDLTSYMTSSDVQTIFNKGVEMAPVDANGNLDWNQFPVKTWVMLPRDKDLGHYDANNNFVVENSLYNWNDDNGSRKSVPHQLRLINIYYNKRAQDEGATYNAQYVKFITIRDDPSYAETMGNGSALSYVIKDGGFQWSDHTALPVGTRYRLVDSMSLSGSARTFTARQTFNNYAPRTPVAPTNGNDLTNKTYVDNAIAAAITTTLGGSF